jgi:predicted CoA-substrate-specific enzyme activase
MRYVAGIDVGTGLTKAVVVGRHGGADSSEPPLVAGQAIERTGARLEAAARAALQGALDRAGLDRSDVEYVASTGFGRHVVPFRDIQITEITSGARGAAFLVPGVGYVLDIGNQATRAVAVLEGGRVGRFKTNDKCAAGSGSFLLRAAKYLQVGMEEIGELALASTSPQPISSVCAVLAESEIINHVSAGVAVEDILRGIYDSLADRSALLLKRTGFAGELAMIGGMARQRGMVRALEDRLSTTVVVPAACEHVCAIGAALLGLKRLDAQRARAAEARLAEAL